MARKGFNAGAELAKGEGAVFKNAKVGAHSFLLTGIYHMGEFADVFTKNGKDDPKKPCNFVIAELTLMGKDDFNEDGSRIRQFKPIPLKNGAKATLTKFLDAIDPKEEKEGFDECIGLYGSVTMVGSKELNEEGEPKYVNVGDISAIDEDAQEMAQARFDKEADDIEITGHITFDKLTEEVLRNIPPHLVRQYILSEGKGTNNSYKGSAVAELIKEIRESDPEFLKKQDKKESTPDNKEKAESRTEKQTDIPADDVAAPDDLDDEAEY